MYGLVCHWLQRLQLQPAKVIPKDLTTSTKNEICSSNLSNFHSSSGKTVKISWPPTPSSGSHSSYSGDHPILSPEWIEWHAQVTVGHERDPGPKIPLRQETSGRPPSHSLNWPVDPVQVRFKIKHFRHSNDMFNNIQQIFNCNTYIQHIMGSKMIQVTPSDCHHGQVTAEIQQQLPQAIWWYAGGMNIQKQQFFGVNRLNRRIETGFNHV